jgi:hypothetical protein
MGQHETVEAPAKPMPVKSGPGAVPAPQRGRQAGLARVYSWHGHLARVYGTRLPFRHGMSQKSRLDPRGFQQGHAVIVEQALDKGPAQSQPFHRPANRPQFLVQEGSVLQAPLRIGDGKAPGRGRDVAVLMIDLDRLAGSQRDGRIGGVQDLLRRHMAEKIFHHFPVVHHGQVVPQKTKSGQLWRRTRLPCTGNLGRDGSKRSTKSSWRVNCEIVR